MPGATLSCPAGNGKHWLATAVCAEYVLKFREPDAVLALDGGHGRVEATVLQTCHHNVLICGNFHRNPGLGTYRA